jgi:hypothetical protein
MTSETLHGMMQASARLVAGDSGGPLSGTNGVIGMDTAASGSGSNPSPLGQARPGQPAAPAPALSCYTSDTGLTPPPATAPVNSGVLGCR